MEERLYWLGFSVFSGIGPVRFNDLLRVFGSASAAWESSQADLQQVLGEKTLAEFVAFRKTFSLEDYARLLLKKGVTFLTLKDANYPHILAEIPKAPFVLYVRGNMDVISSGTRNPKEISLLRQAQDRNDSTIAVVGSRKVTSYGRDVTEMFVRDLVQFGLTIVSGLAMGVDSIAHRVTVQNQGKTIAVLGCGVDCCFPSENLLLYDQIIENGGAIVSELPLGHPPSKGSFPARNRIIAGLSQAVLVTEGTEDSGSLITADYAFKFNRSVFAVPGPITSQLSKGPYKLLQKGAKLVTSGEEIIQELGITGIKSTTSTTGKERVRGETQEEEIILALLQNEALSFDEIVRLSNLSSSQVGTVLSLMELKGQVKQSTSGFFSLI